MGSSLSVRPADQQWEGSSGSELLWCVRGQESGWSWRDFVPSRPKFTENFCIWFFLKDHLKKLFVAQKIGHLSEGEYSMHNWANANGYLWNWNTKNKKSEINTFKFHLFMLISSHSWVVFSSYLCQYRYYNLC